MEHGGSGPIVFELGGRDSWNSDQAKNRRRTDGELLLEMEWAIFTLLHERKCYRIERKIDELTYTLRKKKASKSGHKCAAIFSVKKDVGFVIPGKKT